MAGTDESYAIELCTNGLGNGGILKFKIACNGLAFTAYCGFDHSPESKLLMVAIPFSFLERSAWGVWNTVSDSMDLNFNYGNLKRRKTICNCYSIFSYRKWKVALLPDLRVQVCRWSLFIPAASDRISGRSTPLVRIVDVMG